MKLLKIVANNYKNCERNFSIDFLAKSRKTSEDKLYELQEIADELYCFNVCSFVGKNASGKTTALELVDCCYTILSTFHLSSIHFDADDVELLMYFYYDKYIYKYYTKLKDEDGNGDKIVFTEQKIYVKKYYKTKVSEIYSDEGFAELNIDGELPDDTSKLFFVLKKGVTRAVYFDCYGENENTYKAIFKAMRKYNISNDILFNIIKIFDDSIKDFSMVDEHNYKLNINGINMFLSDQELLYRLSSGTTKGMLLYIYVYAALKYGFDLLIDEIENHFHKTLVENIFMLFKDKKCNKKNATLMFTTHYCELLDLFNRSDNIWILNQHTNIEIKNYYEDFDVRNDLLKSKKFYENTFDTAVNYNALMNFKKGLF